MFSRQFFFKFETRILFANLIFYFQVVFIFWRNAYGRLLSNRFLRDPRWPQLNRWPVFTCKSTLSSCAITPHCVFLTEASEIQDTVLVHLAPPLYVFISLQRAPGQSAGNMMWMLVGKGRYHVWKRCDMLCYLIWEKSVKWIWYVMYHITWYPWCILSCDVICDVICWIGCSEQ